MEKIQLEDLHRHLLSTSHFKEPAYLDDQWYDAHLDIDLLHIAHPDFRGFPLKKEIRYCDYLPLIKPLIDSGYFPFAAEIKKGLAQGSANFPPLVVSERKPGKFYVIDGQRRVITQWYQGMNQVRAYIYKGNHIL